MRIPTAAPLARPCGLLCSETVQKYFKTFELFQRKGQVPAGRPALPATMAVLPKAGAAAPLDQLIQDIEESKLSELSTKRQRGKCGGGAASASLRRLRLRQGQPPMGAIEGSRPLLLLLLLPLTTYYLLPTTYYLLPTTYDLRPTTYDLRPTTYDLRPTTYYLLPTTYYLLPTTYHLLPTTYYLLPTTYHLLLTPYSLHQLSTRFSTDGTARLLRSCLALSVSR